MKKYMVLKSEIEVARKEYDPQRFYSLDEPWSDGNTPKEVGLCDNLKEAEDLAREQDQFVWDRGRYYEVQEVYIEAVEWDEDSEDWVTVGECWNIPRKAEMKEGRK